MQQLKRIGWKIGQPLLPVHLVAQEESLLSHLGFYIKTQGLPYYGVGQLIWDSPLLQQGVVSISKLTVVFLSGEVIDVPENGQISIFDLNKTAKNHVSLYLHLLKDGADFEMPIDQTDEEEKVIYQMNQLVLSSETHLNSTKACLKLAEFEKNIENRWQLVESFAPPLISIQDHPFLQTKLVRLRTVLDGFQKELEQESGTGKLFEQRTLETKFSLVEVSKLRRFLLNVERNVVTHPYFLYEHLSDFLDTLAFFYVMNPDLTVIPYQHEKLALLFGKLIELLIQYIKPKSEETKYLSFERRDNCYVSDKLPQELQHVNELFLIIQPLDLDSKMSLDGLRVASYSRLANVVRFALSGIALVRLESAPFNNNFSKFAAIFRIEKDWEWGNGVNEGRIAFTAHEENQGLQAFLSWR